MKAIEILYDIIKLNCNNVEICNYQSEREDMIFSVRGKGKRGRCGCGKKSCKRKDRLLHDGGNLKHISFSDGRQLMIHPLRRRFICETCNQTFLEKFSFEAKAGKHTLAFEQYVMAAWGYMSGCEIGRQTKTSNSKIHKILHNIDPEILNKEGRTFMELVDEIWIGIDEHSFKGRDMVAIIVDIKEMVPLAILSDNKTETIQARFKSLPMEIKQKIRGVASDMNAGYIKRIEEVVGKTISVIDKYHLVQEANRMVDEVRALNGHLVRNNLVDIDEYLATGKIPKQVQEHIDSKLGAGNIGKYKKGGEEKTLDETYFSREDLTNKAGRVIDFKEITLSHYLNVKGGYRMLFMKREENLSGIQRLRLRQILREFDYKGYMQEAWTLKERFAQALDDKEYNEIEEIRRQALGSEHYRITKFGRTLKRWDVQLKNYCTYAGDHSTTNAGTEAFNRVCKTGKLVSCGRKHKKNYLKKTGTRLARNTRDAIAKLQE